MAVIILGSGSTPVTGTREITVSPTAVTPYTFGNGFIDSNSTISVGGTLTANVTIDGDDTYSMFLGTNYVGKQLDYFDVWADSGIRLMSAGNGGGGFGAGGRFELGNNYCLLSCGFSTSKGFEIDSDDFVVYDYDNSRGIEYAADYTANAITRTLVDRGFVETVSENVMHVAQGNVLYSNTAQTTIVTVPADAVIWDVQVWVITGFTDSGTDLLDIGYTGITNRFEAALDISSTGFKTMTLTNVPSRVGATNITFQYTGQNGDAGAGSAMVYIHYSLH